MRRTQCRLMGEAKYSESFEQIVEWAYSTLPQEIRDLPDFPGIQVLDEPPENVLKRKKLLPKRETLGLYSGIRRTQQRHDDIRIAPNLIFVFRGPIQRCSRGDLRAEVKEVVWHEVAHWLGHSEEEMKELGLATLTLPTQQAAHHRQESEENESAKMTPLQQFADTLDETDKSKEPRLRCVKCYSADVACHELDKPLSAGSWLSEPVSVHTKSCTCKSCGYTWDDEDST
jgi:predicted Zn-dependent protease with MMP-like domain